MSLEKVLEQIKTVKPVANEDVDSGPAETLAGRRGRKRQAQDTLKRLREEYANELLRGSLFILVTGAARDEFSSAASESFGCFASDPESFYRELADRVSPVLYNGKEGTAGLFDVVGRHLEDKALEIGILGYPQMIFKQHYNRHIATKDDFVGLLKQAINEQVGGEIVGIHAVRSVVDTAIEKGHSAKVTPIVLNTSDDKLAIELLSALERLTPRVFLVVAGEASKQLKSVDGAIVLNDGEKETVKKVLKTIKGSLKK